MHLMRENWTDARLDDLNAKVDSGFERLDARIDRLDVRMDRLEQRMEGFEHRMDAKFDALQRLMFLGLLGIMATMIGGFATLLAAQLWL